MKFHRLYLFGVLFVVVGVTRVNAQTRFEWPAAITRVSNDSTIEDCVAAIFRVMDSVKNRDPVWSDTVPYNQQSARESSSQRVIATARNCTARFAAATAPLNDFELLLKVFLVAGREEDAHVLVRRRLAKFPSDGSAQADSLRAVLLDSVFKIVMDSIVVPKRVAFLEPYLEQLVRNPQTPWYHTMWWSANLAGYAAEQGDDARARRWEDFLLEFHNRVDDEEKQRRSRENFLASSTIVPMLMHRDISLLLDSLGHSTSAYTAAMSSLSRKAMGLPMESLFGREAPVIEGEFVANVDGSQSTGSGPLTPARPVRGKVNLVVMMRGEEPYFDGEGVSGDWLTIAILRRLANQFPELEITVIMNTIGAFGPAKPPSPQEEAQWYFKLWKDFHKAPGTLVVRNTPFWRIEPPQDRRRVNHDIMNAVSWAFGARSDAMHGAYIIDSDGLFVWNGPLERGWMETVFSDFIRTLLQRDAQRSSTRTTHQSTESSSILH